MTYQDWLKSIGKTTEQSNPIRKTDSQLSYNDWLGSINKTVPTTDIEDNGISPERQLSLARDFYNQRTNVTGAQKAVPALPFSKAQGVVLPADDKENALSKIASPNITKYNKISEKKPSNLRRFGQDIAQAPLGLARAMGQDIMGTGDFISRTGEQAMNALSVPISIATTNFAKLIGDKFKKGDDSYKGVSYDQIWEDQINAGTQRMLDIGRPDEYFKSKITGDSYKEDKLFQKEVIDLAKSSNAKMKAGDVKGSFEDAGKIGWYKFMKDWANPFYLFNIAGVAEGSFKLPPEEKTIFSMELNPAKSSFLSNGKKIKSQNKVYKIKTEPQKIVTDSGKRVCEPDLKMYVNKTKTGKIKVKVTNKGGDVIPKNLAKTYQETAGKAPENALALKEAPIETVRPTKPITPEIADIRAVTPVVKEIPTVIPKPPVGASQVATRGQQTPIQNIKTQPLEQEAKKYKTADEFIKGQGGIMYHGTNSKFDNFNNKFKGKNTDEINTKIGHFFSRNKNDVNDFKKTWEKMGGKTDKWKVVEAVKPKESELLSLNQHTRKMTIKEAEDLVDYLGTEDGKELKGQKALDYINEMLFEDPLGMTEGIFEHGNSFAKEMEKKGYKGIIGDFGNGVDEIVVFDAKDIKTSSQLKDIWNKAHKIALSKKTKTLSSKKVNVGSNLTKEAKKYKTADEFANKQINAYHGTDKDFKEFSKEFIGENQPTDFGDGLYFAKDKKSAIGYAKEAGGNKVMEVRLDIKHPAKNKDLVDVDIQNAIDDNMGFKDVGDVLKEKGFDGIEFTRADGTIEYTVFDTNQIKTKSQLKDIWNEAHKPTVSKTTKKEVSFKDWYENVSKHKVSPERPRTPKVIKKNEPEKVSKKVETLAKKQVKETEKIKDITQRLAKEKEAYANREKGGKITIRKIEVEPEKKPIEPNYKTATSAEIGNYYIAKERWDLIHSNKKVKKPKIKDSENDIKGKKIISDYSNLLKKETPEDQDFLDMSKLEKKYNDLTGHDLSVDYSEVETTDLSMADFDREYEPENQMPDTFYSVRANKGKTTIGGEGMRRKSNIGKQEVANIEAGRRKFSIAQESINLVRKYKAKLTSNNIGTEGHNAGDIIGYDSLNNPLLLAHELTHLLTNNGTHVLKLLYDEGVKAELRKCYKKYYPGAPKKIDDVNPYIVYNEGMAEFVRQHLFNPQKANKEFPNLSKKFLGNGPLSRPEVSEMYNDVNNIIYVYQRLSPEKQGEALMATDVDFKKLDLKSIVLSKVGRNINHFQDGLFSFHELDRLDRYDPGKEAHSQSFLIDREGHSVEMLASMAQPSIKIALSNFDEKANSVNIINEKGQIEKIGNFGIGKFLKKIIDNGDVEGYGAYLRAVDDQRDRDNLKRLKEKLLDIIKEMSEEDDPKLHLKLSKQADQVKKDVNRFNRIVSSQASGSVERDTKIIKNNKRKYAKYEGTFKAITDLIVRLDERKGAISKKTADEWISRPGYAPSFRQKINDLEDFYNGINKRSAKSRELRARKGSNKAIINPIISLPNMLISAFGSFNSQSFYNLLYDKCVGRGLIHETGKGTVNEKGTYIRTHDGKYTSFNVLDPELVLSIENTYGFSGFNNKIAQMADSMFHGTARFFQKLTTQYNPSFIYLKNLGLDIPTAFIFTQTKYIPFYSQATRLIGNLLKKTSSSKDKIYSNEYDLLGGSGMAMSELSYDKQNPINVANNIASNFSKFKKIKIASNKVVEKISNFTEKLMRKEEFIRARRQGDSTAEAFEKSRNVSGSFHKNGVYSKYLGTRYIPFENAQIQLTYQYAKAIKNKRSRRRFGTAMALASLISFGIIYRKVKKLDNAKTEEERELAMHDLYRYLDESTYNKVNYFPIGRSSKFVSNPILSAPGTLAGLLLIKSRIPEYKIDYADFAYQSTTSILPGQFVPEIGDSDTIFNSVLGKIVGAAPVINSLTALAGHKTYPGFSSIENQSQQRKPLMSQRYDVDTNNAAILIGQLSNFSPLRLSHFFKNSSGTVGGYLSDMAGSLAMSSDYKDQLGITHKTAKDLLWTGPTKSAITRTTKDLVGETTNRVYKANNAINIQLAKNKMSFKKLWIEYGVTKSTDLPPKGKEKASVLWDDRVKLQQQLKFVTKVKNAISVLSKYEKRGKQVDIGVVNAINKASLEINIRNTSLLTDDERRKIDAVARMYSTIGKKDWSKVPDIKK